MVIKLNTNYLHVAFIEVNNRNVAIKGGKQLMCIRLLPKIRKNNY